MPKWTKEQQEAILKDGTNIIVSAGAGSGKTAVLTERVIYKLQKGIKINELLILTFTNAAAGEMKDRIRKNILKHPELNENLDYLESAYITTFDAYTLSLVKKYSYLLNISNDLKIVDSGIISLLKSDILDEIFEEYYKSGNEYFQKLINDLTVKDDTNLKNELLKIIDKITLKSDPLSYLDNYLNTYLSNDAINNYINEYEEYLHTKINNLENLIMQIDTSIYPDYVSKMSDVFSKLIVSSSYDEIIKNIPERLPSKPKDSEDLTEFKNAFDIEYKDFKDSLRFLNINEIKESFNILKEYLNVIIPIFKEFITRLNNYKFKNDVYEFTDIAALAIKLLKENDYIKEELKHTFKEILVDEYQDTNDIQEEFISLIENNNVYMVGDIKQSIYGFRNANPSIFKNKYDNYSKISGGIKIDLLANFRSRSEVINNINEIFSFIMTDDLGGANYKIDHQMNFGNTLYEENKTKDDYNLEILNYELSDDFSKEEIEYFIIAKDIIKKLKNNYQVFDKDSEKLRSASYKDFCIILDRGKTFPLAKKIFEYLGIPLTIYEDKDLTNEIDTMLISNLLKFIIKIKDNIKDIEFKYYFMSIARSFIFAYDDNTIFNCITNNTYMDTDIYKIASAIASNLDNLSNYEIVSRIISDFNIYEAIIKIGNVEDIIIRLDNLLDIAKNLDMMGYTYRDFNEYISRMLEDDNNKIKYVSVMSNQDAVKIMNIHKSKGLEFPVCYFAGFHKEFNTEDVKKQYVYDNKYGIILPYFDDGLTSSILKDLFKNRYLINDISEKIRLLYVALTRAKEKMIIVTNFKNDEKYISNYKSFLDILESIKNNLNKYITNVNLDLVGLTKDYLDGSVNNIIDREDFDKKITFKSLNIPNREIENKKASKEVNELLTEDELNTLAYGTYVHKYLEQTDFLNIEDDNPYKDAIKYLVSNLKINKDTKIYKEHEFIYEIDNIEYNGIIDLVLENNDNVIIVDYKLKNIADEKYIEQLKIYYEYLKNIFNKEIKVYLFSIINKELKEIAI